MLEANQILKYKKTLPTLNSYDNMCEQERKNNFSCLHTIRKTKDDLANTTYKYQTQYRGNCSYIHNDMGDQCHIALKDMVP